MNGAGMDDLAEPMVSSLTQARDYKRMCDSYNRLPTIIDPDGRLERQEVEIIIAPPQGRDRVSAQREATMPRFAAIVAALVITTPASAQTAKQYDSIAVFEHCAKIENAVRDYILAWQIETPKETLIAEAKGDRARIAIINDLYDGPARGRTKSDIVAKWEQRCVADPKAFGFKS